jgi:hypothetical protein
MGPAEAGPGSTPVILRRFLIPIDDEHDRWSIGGLQLEAELVRKHRENRPKRESFY